MSHTPGPWRANWIRPDHSRGHTFDPTCAILADTAEYGTVRVADIPDPLTPEEEANACLVAAAPDLLDACEVALDALRDLTDHYTSGTIQRLEAVIAQAKGES